VANDITSNPWKLDTPATISMPSRVKINNIVWGDYTTAGDTLLITDLNGKQIVKAVVGANVGEFWTFGGFGWVNGIILSTISHGEVTIAIGAGK
jgi:hypothetical protein